MSYPRVVLGLPWWLEELVPDPERVYPSEEDRMRLVIELSRWNVAHGTGGPCRAGVCSKSTPGVEVCSITPARANDGYVVPRDRLLGGGR